MCCPLRECWPCCEGTHRCITGQISTLLTHWFITQLPWFITQLWSLLLEGCRFLRQHFQIAYAQVPNQQPVSVIFADAKWDQKMVTGISCISSKWYLYYYLMDYVIFPNKKQELIFYLYFIRQIMVPFIHSVKAIAVHLHTMKSMALEITKGSNTTIDDRSLYQPGLTVVMAWISSILQDVITHLCPYLNGGWNQGTDQ